MSPAVLQRLGLASLLWTLLLVLTLFNRGLMPIDETRYVSVAWEMWVNHHWLVPLENGLPYSDKPPLLFWLMHAGWALFGVSDWWPRMVAPLFALGSLWLLPPIGRLLWGADGAGTGASAALLVSAGLLWCVFASATMFDMLLVFFALLGLFGVLLAWRSSRVFGFGLLALAIGLGVLAKGPVILLHTLPAALLAPWWMREQRPAKWWPWYLGVLAAVLGGAVIALAWALPAAAAGGEEYANAILWGQTAGRVAHSFAHRRPFWWYVPLLPLVLLPLSLWGGFWRGLAAVWRQRDSAGVRFCLAWFLPAFVLLSLISGKQLHYLLPILPALALLVGRVTSGVVGAPPRYWWVAAGSVAIAVALLIAPNFARYHSEPWWLADIGQVGAWLLLGWALLLLGLAQKVRLGPEAVLAVTAALWLLAIHLSLIAVAREAYDLRPVGRFLGGLEKAGVEIVHAGGYADQYQFAGRLQRPLQIVNDSPDGIAQWLDQHPEGAVIHYHHEWQPRLRQQFAYAQPYRGGALLISLGARAAAR